MNISTLIDKLMKVRKKYGDLEVRIDSVDDIIINSVCYVNVNPSYTTCCHVRLTDNKEAIFDCYEEDPDDTNMIVEEF